MKTSRCHLSVGLHPTNAFYPPENFLNRFNKKPMSSILKIACNGLGQHLNEIDLDKVLQPTVVIRGWFRPKPKEIQARYVLRCQHCTEGRVVITREMIEEHRRESTE
jgi:hypothetical protein